MKRNFYRCLSTMLAAVMVMALMFTGVAAAADGQEYTMRLLVTRELELFQTNIEVTLEPAEARIPVTVVVSGPVDKDYVEQGYTDKTGTVRFQYVNKGVAGKYTVTVRSIAGQQQDEFAYLSPDAMVDITKIVVDEINSDNPDASTVKNALYPNREGLKLDMALYGKLKNPDNVYRVMLQDTADNANIKNIDDVAKLFHIAVMLCALEENGSGEMMTMLSTTVPYSGYLDLTRLFPPSETESGKNVYEALSSNEKSHVLAAAAGKYSALGELQQSLLFQTLAKGIQYADSWKKVVPLMTAYQKASLLDVSFTDYNNLKNKNIVSEGMVGKPYSNYAAVKSGFDGLVAQQLKKENTTSGTTGGGGGSKRGSSGGSGGITIPTPPKGTPPEAVDQPVTPTRGGFADMDDAKWAIRAVQALAEKEIVGGTGNGNFEPNRSITRGEVVKMLTGILPEGMEPAAEGPTAFTDVAESDWFFPYVTKAARTGVVMGDADGSFRPNDAVTREEMAVMAARILGGLTVKAPKSPKAFADQNDCSPWALEAIEALQTAGVVTGDLSNRYNPKNALTRAEAAQIIYQILVVTGNL